MPPVEVSSYPASPSLPPVKVVDKALELPVLSDAVSEVSKYAHNISENGRVKHARQLVSGCIQGIADNERLASVKESVLPLTTTVKDTLLPHLTSVRESMMPRVAGAVETLDNMACGGLDHLKEAVPSLTYPTPELVESVREAASGYCSMLAEYLASFSLAQVSLQLTDKSLVLLEAATARLLPESKGCAYLRSLRRSVRAARRAGARRNLLSGDELSRSGFLGRLASSLHLNSLFGLVGLELVPTPASAAAGEEDDQPSSSSRAEARQELPEARVEDLHADMSAYRSEEDPDFEAGDHSSGSSSQDSDEELKAGASSSETEDETVEEGEDKAEDKETEDDVERVSTAEELNEDSFISD